MDNKETMRKLKTKYHYRERWQYQDIYVDLDTLDIIRDQNFMKDGIIVSQTDIIKDTDDGYEFLWKKYGKPAIIGLLNGNN